MTHTALNGSMEVQTIMDRLTERPSQHPDCCCSLSLNVLDTLIRHLPKSPAQVLSVSLT